MKPSSEMTTLTITLTPELSAALDRYVTEVGADYGSEMAASQALREWAISKGYLASGDEGMRPDQLNAANDG